MLRLLAIALTLLACPSARGQAIMKLWDPAYVAVRPGASVELMVMAQIRPGYVVIAHQAEDAMLQPLTLRFRPARQALVGAPRYPAAQEAPVDADRRKLPTHAGTLSIAVPVTVSKQAAPGALTLQGELRYQACVELRCSAMRTLPVRLTIDVLPAKG
jgi:hypothetical protein